MLWPPIKTISSELSQQDGSYDGSQNMLLCKNMDNYPKITFLYLEHWVPG